MAKDGGNFDNFVNYAANGNGMVNESDMPFRNSEYYKDDYFLTDNKTIYFAKLKTYLNDKLKNL